MSVLYLTINPNLGSTTRVLQDWLQCASKMGIEPHVVVCKEGPFSKWLTEQQIDHLVCGMPWLSQSRPWQGIRQLLKIGVWARRRGIKLIHCNEHNAYPFAIALSRVCQAAIVCHVRCKLDAGFADWAFGKREPDALIWCTPQMETECGTVTQANVRHERQHVIPLGIDLNRFSEPETFRANFRRQIGCSADEVVVGMASAIRPGKRIEDYLTLTRKLKERYAARFVLAGGCVPGDEQYFEQIRPHIESAQVAGTLTWLGHVESIAPFLHAIDVFVSTSEHESFGMSVCEAMACAKPVAAYAACSVAGVVGKSGLIVETRDLDGLIAATEQLLTNALLRKSLGQQARSRVATEFNPEKSFMQLKEVYESIVTRKS